MWSGGRGTAVCCRRFKANGLGLKNLFLLLAFSLVPLASHPAHAAERLYYFWSFSMPEESLKTAFAEGEKVGLVAVLRGLPEGSTKESLIRLRKLQGERKMEMVIDPLLFRLYDITAVPVFIYAEGVNTSCEHCGPVPKHWKVVGDVSLNAALENLARSAPQVDQYLKKLREGFYSK